jgi:uncharacterized hydrophobic protein (TIGR00271 family)
LVIRNWFLPISRSRKADVLEELKDASSPGFDFFLLVMLSCAIATFGLITNSAAVIIGAMLVAPLMSPILGLSLATVVAESRLFQRAVLALIEGVAMALTLSALLGWLSRILPFDLLIDLPSEVLSRARPTPLDLGIALAGGAAAAYALAQPRLSAALPGVAIATALMPPLCAAGVGLSVGRWDVALGAILLFITNLAAISFAGILVFVALGFRPERVEVRWHRIPRSLLISAVLVLLVTVPLVLLTLRLVGEAEASKLINDTVAAEVATLPDSQMLEMSVEQKDTGLHLYVTILTTNPPTYEQVVSLQSEIAIKLNRPVALQLIVVPGTRLDPLLPPTRTPTSTPTVTYTPTTTRTVTYTPSPTRTITNTPTAVPAYITNTGGRGVFLRQEPAGSIIVALPELTEIQILYRRVIVVGQEWLEIRTLTGLEGWVPAAYVAIRP